MIDLWFSIYCNSNRKHLIQQSTVSYILMIRR